MRLSIELRRMRMRKVLIVTTIYKTYEQFLISHAEYLKNSGFDIDLATNFPKSADHVSSVLSKVHHVPFPRGIKPIKIVKSYLTIKKVLREKYDYLYLHTPIASFITRLGLSQNMNRTKVIYFVHGFHFFKGSSIFSWILYYSLEKMVVKRTDTFITINKQDYITAKVRLKAENVIMFNGVGLSESKMLKLSNETNDPFLGYAKTRNRILSIGELNKNKNHRFIIKQLSHLKFDFRYFICGTGHLMKKLKKDIKKYHLEEKVFLLGYCQNPINLLKNASLLIHGSKREGLPVSIMEAMYMKTPILASNIRGNCDLIEHKKGGYLYNDASEFSLYLNKLLTMDDLTKKRFIEFNQKKIESYLQENVIQGLSRVFE